ncbi:MAG TPA: hypothetical protein VEC35_12505 [Noviherbaspirillum sp.]|nr:hypothetical protein [Noviherbaspirillum sp.]
MIQDLIYNNPLWLVGSLVVIVPVILVCAALRVFHRMVPHSAREAHNEHTSFTISAIGINYAVLVAFIAVAVWGSFDKATDVASKEAELVGDIFRDARGLGDPVAGPIREHLRNYVTIVIEEEWPAMARTETPRAGWKPLEDIQDLMVAYRPQHGGQAAYMQEVLHQLNELRDARRDRLAAAESGVEPVVWIIVLIGTALTVGFTFLLGMPSLRMHMLLTDGFTAATMLVLVLVIAFDWPFRGELQVAPSMFKSVQENITALDARSK